MNQAHISEFVIASMKAETFGTWLIEGFNTRTVKLLDCYFNFESASGRESLVETARKILDDKELETLQRAWSQVFCIGPGCVPPEESVVKTGLSMQEPRDMALDWYYRFKIKPAAGLPADNLGVELLFLGRILSSIPEDNETEKTNVLKETETFVRERLAWTKDFYVSLENKKDTPDFSLILPFVSLILEFIDELSGFLSEHLESVSES